MNAPAQPQTATDPKRPNRNRLLIAVVLIALAVAGLAAVEQFREHPVTLPAPHEPSQALISPPAAAPEPSPATASDARPVQPPPPPVVVNEPYRPPLPVPTSRTVSPALADSAGYLVQAGVFTSSANAQSLQQKLAKAGIRAKVETRVQLGPFKDRREAEQALGKLKKLGVNAVMVPVH